MEIKNCIVAVCFLCIPFALKAQVRNVEEITVSEAKQGVAVDSQYFYVVNNSDITKHRKDSGLQVAKWNGESYGVKHLNGGVVIGNRLYCTNSNYPKVPMTSSIEIFDTDSLSHVDSHSIGIDYGSLTSIDFKDNSWWAVFAHYNNDDDYRSNKWTSLVKFTEDWIKTAAWVFPDTLIKQFGDMSCSGALWGTDGNLYLTGHDLKEMYVLQIPKIGSTLDLLRIIDVPLPGQGIALDKSVVPNVFYGINRARRQVIRFSLDEAAIMK
ncbi:hypothetical protein [Olivibacter sitiensis]|uniref:hypothetical protein n=1 Tax=Olivibacter sitiensis TaxID=376470 RepID=UPI0004042758|nr:hypothetical protein [Olivibacter sitiensis]